MRAFPAQYSVGVLMLLSPALSRNTLPFRPATMMVPSGAGPPLSWPTAIWRNHIGAGPARCFGARKQFIVIMNTPLW